MTRHAVKNQPERTKRGIAEGKDQNATDESESVQKKPKYAQNPPRGRSSNDAMKSSVESSSTDVVTSEQGSHADRGQSNEIPNDNSSFASLSEECNRNERCQGEKDDKAGFLNETKPTERTCASCGLRMPSNATDSQWCSEECEKHGIDDMDRALERKINQMLDARRWPATICPSEPARALGGADWRPLMEPVRRAARRMVARGEVEITQRGVVVDPSTTRGPIRIRRPPPR